MEMEDEEGVELHGEEEGEEEDVGEGEPMPSGCKSLVRRVR